MDVRKAWRLKSQNGLSMEANPTQTSLVAPKAEVEPSCYKMTARAHVLVKNASLGKAEVAGSDHF
jgi:hypothetical protein